MTRRTRLREATAPVWLLAVVLALSVGFGASRVIAQPLDGGTDDGVLVLVYSPTTSEAALGRVRVHFDVFAEPPFEARLVVDGEERERFTGGSFEAFVELGDENVEHVFEIVVERDGHELARERRVTPAIRVDEEVDLGLQQLYVSVLRDGRPVRGLRAEDFRILDQGREQPLVTFEGGDAAIAAAVLVDASQSMEGGPLQAALRGAVALLDRLRGYDEAAVYTFSDRLLFRSPWISAEDGYRELSAQLRRLEAGGGTALQDALEIALRDLETRQGRRVVVLLTDGVDVHSAMPMEAVHWTARRSRSIVYWIRLAAPERGVVSVWKSAPRHARARELLETVVSESGGRNIEIESADAARRAFQSVMRELRSQVVLGFYPDVDLDDGAWHEIEVLVAAPGARVRTREGYVDR